MKVKSAIRAICKHCYVIKRGKTRYVYCKKNPKHKQRQGFHTMCCVQERADGICDLESDLERLSFSKPMPWTAEPLSIRNPLDYNTVAPPTAEKKPIKYHPELGISQIYWNF
jgi:ribosomal protein L36